MMMQTPAVLSLAVVASFLVGLSKGGVPTIGSLAVPLLALVMAPVTAAALLLPIFIVSDVVAVYLYRKEFSVRNLAILIPAALAGIGLGWTLGAWLSGGFIGLLVGATGLFFCANAWFFARRARPARPADISRGAFWGMLTGLTSFVSHSGGPTFQMYVLPQRLPKMVYAGTATILFAIVNAAKIVPYWQLGQFTGIDPSAALWLAIPALGGTLAGRWLTRSMPDRLFFRLVEIALLAVSLKLVWDYVSTLGVGG